MRDGEETLAQVTREIEAPNSRISSARLSGRTSAGAGEPTCISRTACMIQLRSTAQHVDELCLGHWIGPEAALAPASPAERVKTK